VDHAGRPGGLAAADARELVKIFAECAELPAITWTITPGGHLTGRVGERADPDGGRAAFTAWRRALGMDDFREWHRARVLPPTCGPVLCVTACASRSPQPSPTCPKDSSRRRYRNNLACSRDDEPMTVDWTRELSGQFDLGA
jgi:hypothetical protein